MTLSPNVPSSGAGITALKAIPEAPPGDIDLIAPLGIIDAGEAGIRVSGNVNLINAANIATCRAPRPAFRPCRRRRSRHWSPAIT
ncbi:MULTISPECIES: filamentous haemagglutinin family protein [unclassified Bradyrhizobium]